MNDEMLKDVASMVKDALDAIKRGDTYLLHSISDHTVHSSTVYQNDISIDTAVVLYAISKLMERNLKLPPQILSRLQNSLRYLQKRNVKAYENQMHIILKLIRKVDTKLDKYIQEVINEAQIKKGSRIYEHGISLGQTANLMGLSQWELSKYLGRTKINDEFRESTKVKTRLQYVKELFSL